MPFSDAVARSVPVELIDRKEIGALCACTTLMTVLECVLYIMTSPDCACEADVEGCWLMEDDAVEGEGTDEG